jgi:hypothetical protein
MGDKGSGCEHGLLLSFDRYKLLSISYTLSERRMMGRRGWTGRGQKRKYYEVSQGLIKKDDCGCSRFEYPERPVTPSFLPGGFYARIADNPFAGFIADRLASGVCGRATNGSNLHQLPA